MSADNPYTSPTTQSRNVPAPPLDLKSLLFSFDGRIPRRVYWGASIAMGVAVSVIVFVVVFIATMIFGNDSMIPTLIVALAYIPLLWASLALTVKRWHDRGKSGWWILIGFVPFIGWLWAFIEQGCLRGTVGPNNYGLDPT